MYAGHNYCGCAPIEMLCSSQLLFSHVMFNVFILVKVVDMALSATITDNYQNCL